MAPLLEVISVSLKALTSRKVTTRSLFKVKLFKCVIPLKAFALIVEMLSGNTKASIRVPLKVFALIVVKVIGASALKLKLLKEEQPLNYY